MARTGPVATTYNMLCKFYEQDVSIHDVQLSVDSLYGKNKQHLQHLRNALEGAVLNSMSLDEQDKALLLSANHGDLRTKILYNLGFRITEADEVLENINISSVPANVDHAFRGGGSKNQVRPLDHKAAAYVSAILETPISALLSDGQAQVSPIPEPWYCYTNELQHLEFALPITPVAHRRHNRPRRCGRRKLVRGANIGRVYLSDLRCDIGVTVLYMPDLVQVAYTTDCNTHAVLSRWEKRLIEFGKTCGISGPAVYTVASPFLSKSAVRIRRLTWLLTRDARSIVRLYSRVFSPRTSEVSIMGSGEWSTFKYPSQTRHSVVHALRDAGIIGPQSTCESMLI